MGVSVGFGLLGLGASYNAAKKQEAAAEKTRQAEEAQRKEQKKIADIKAARDKRKILREARIQQAAIKLIQGSDSRAQGASASVGTQAASAVGFVGQQQEAGTTIFEQGNIIGQASVDLAKAGTQAQLGATIFDLGVSGKAQGAYNWITS